MDGVIYPVCDFIKHLLKKFDPQGYVAFEWSNDCNKPKTDAYGGGAAFITADDIQTIGTWSWVAGKAINHSYLKQAYV